MSDPDATGSLEGDLLASYASVAPHSVAHELSCAEPSTAAAVVARLGTAAACRVLSAISPASGAQILGRLPAPVATSVASALDAPVLANLLRQMPAEARSQVSSNLPQAVLDAIGPLLTYPPSRVGAHALPGVFSVSADTTVAETLAAARGGAERALDVVFVTGDDHVLLGVVRWPRLLTADPQTRAGSLHEHDVGRIDAATQLTELRQHPAWEHGQVAAVIDAAGRLLGGLRRDDLTRLLATPTSHAEDPGQTARELAGLYRVGLSAMWQWVAGQQPPQDDSK